MARRATIAAVTAILALHGMLVWIYYWPLPKALCGDEGMYLPAARSLLATGESNVELLWPPLYAHWLAGLLALIPSLVWVQVVQGALLVVAALVLRDLCCRLGCPRRVGDLAAVLTLADPQLAAFACHLWPEVLHLTLMLCALWIVAARCDRLLWLATLGLALGLAVLTKSILGPFIPVLLVPVAFKGGWRQGPLRVMVVVVALVLTLTPTLVTNARREGTVTVGNSAWFNAWVGLTSPTDEATRLSRVGSEYVDWLRAGPDLTTRNRVYRDRVVARVEQLGAGSILVTQLRHQYFRLFAAGSYLTEQLPGGAIAQAGCGYRGTPPWASRSLRLANHGLYALTLVLAAFGLTRCPLRRQPWTWIALAFVAYHLALFSVLHATTRFRVPLLPVAYIFAGYTFDWLAQWFAAGRRGRLPPLTRAGDSAPEDCATAAREPGPVALVAAAILAAVLLGLAFAGPLVSG